MGIAILIVKDDLETTLKVIGSIDINNQYHYFWKTAKKMDLLLLYTIDQAGDTVINHLQVNIFKDQIQEIRNHSGVNEDILTLLQEAANAVELDKNQYIKFIGD